MKSCKAIGCSSLIPTLDSADFCQECSEEHLENKLVAVSQSSLAELYPKYYKDFSGVDDADVYLVHHRFSIQDPSGCIHHASKKLLLSGVRTGGKSKYDDIKEARDTLTRWLQINSPSETEA